MIFDSDWHVHTRWSACADNITVEDYLLCAKKLGLKCFAITDHSNDIYFEQEERDALKRQTGTVDLKPLLKERAHRLEEYLSYLEAYREYGVRTGIELEQMPYGEFIFDWDYRGDFDVIVGSVHIVPALKRFKGPAELKEKIATEEFISLTLKALDHEIDILAHPTRALRRAGIAVPERDQELIIEKALRRGIALEVNGHSLDPDASFLHRCVKKGVKLAFSTDSHSLKEFGDFTYHKSLLQEAGLTSQHLVKINGDGLLKNCSQLERNA